VLTATVVAAAILMSTQTSSTIPATNMTANCLSLTASVLSVPMGSSGIVTHDCGFGVPAFTAAVFSNSTPAFSLAAGFSDLWVYPSNQIPGATCGATTATRQLTSGTPVFWNNNENGGWNYCADYANAPTSGLGSWAISWSTP